MAMMTISPRFVLHCGDYKVRSVSTVRRVRPARARYTPGGPTRQAAVIGHQAPRPGAPKDRSGNGTGGPARPAACRIILYVAGGSRPRLLAVRLGLGRPAVRKVSGRGAAHEFVLASAVVVVASWGLLLVLGEALLSAGGVQGRRPGPGRPVPQPHDPVGVRAQARDPRALPAAPGAVRRPGRRRTYRAATAGQGGHATIAATGRAPAAAPHASATTPVTASSTRRARTPATRWTAGTGPATGRSTGTTRRYRYGPGCRHRRPAGPHGRPARRDARRPRHGAPRASARRAVTANGPPGAARTYDTAP